MNFRVCTGCCVLVAGWFFSHLVSSNRLEVLGFQGLLVAMIP